MDATRPLQPKDLIEQDKSTGRQEVYGLCYFLCYLLHLILIAIHVVLLVIACYHTEHRIVVSTPSKAFTVGLSGGLQACYTLYTAMLVFVTQRLVLSNVCSNSTKVTEIHDICGAWCGLGAALSALWQQTRVASSIYSVALVTAYFTGISALHVASSTIMEFQPFNTTVTSTVSAVSTWPYQISEFTTSSNWNLPVLSFSPFMQIMYGDTTPGLVNNTLYDVPLSSFVNATVNATTLNTQCGLLTNLSADNNTGNINVSMPAIWLEPLTFFVDINPPLPNEIWLTTASNPMNQSFITYFVSAEIEADESVGGTSHVYINGTFSSPGNGAQNFTTKTYIVACTLDTSTTTATLGSSSALLTLDEQPSSATWPIFSPGGDANLTISILNAMATGTQDFDFPQSDNCLPVMSEPYWQNMTTFETYMISSLGIHVSSCDGTPSVEQYTGSSYMLTRNKMESVISRIAAQFVWIAGQLGEAEGGFDRQTEGAQITEYVLKWRLNLNILPIISSFCASVALFFLVAGMLWGRNNQNVVIHATGPLEIMWFGSRSVALHDYMRRMRRPSVDALRDLSTFKAPLWTQPLYVHATQKVSHSDLCTVLSSHDSASHATVESFDGHAHTENLQPDSRTDQPRRSRGRRWCYALHTAFVSLHVVLLLLLINHPEHHVIIPLETTTFTTGLSALLQAIYTLYSTLLTFILQYLALHKMVWKQQKLTAVHDVSGAWTGIGTATLVLWKQRKLASSPWEVLTVVIYLTIVLVLHITSSSIIQWQVFENSIAIGILRFNSALPDSTVNISSQLRWSEISPIACSTGQDSKLSTYGLSNSTIYDTPQVPENVAASEAVVNATTFTTKCGLVPNLTLLSAEYSTTSGDEQYQIGFSLNKPGNNTLLARPIWKDFLVGIGGECVDCAQTLFYMITTAVDVDESIHDPVSFNLNWTYASPSGADPQNSSTVIYIAACSVSASTAPATLNLQGKKLIGQPNQAKSSASTFWSLWSPAAATNVNVGVVTALSQSYGEDGLSIDPTHITFMDQYLMTLLGLNSSAFFDTSSIQSSADPSVKLTPAQLEDVLSQTAARFMWVAGQLGEANGGFNRTVGQSPATRQVVQYRLNINTIPVIFASGASFVALVVAILILGRKPIESSPSSVSGTSVLEALWLEANSEEIHAHLQAIDEPNEDKLREAGMFYIRLGDVKARRSRHSPASGSEILERVTLIDNSEHDNVISIHKDG